MTGRFRAFNKISNRKLHHIWRKAFKVLRKEHVVVKAINDGFTVENYQTLLKRFNHLESIIKNERLPKLPRKVKKQFLKELSARYNLCLIVMQQWDDFKNIKERQT